MWMPFSGLAPDAPRGSGGGDERWLITYADMITLLLVLFIILYSMANTDLEKFQAMAESLREVTHIRLKTRLGQTHHVVIRNAALGADVGQREHGALACLHERATRFGQRGKAERTDIVRNTETVARDGVEIVAGQEFARSIAHGVDNDIETIPVFGNPVEDCFDLAVVGDIARQDNVGVGLLGTFLDPRQQTLVLIGVGDFRAFAMHGLGDSPGDGTFAGDTHDQGALTG